MEEWKDGEGFVWVDISRGVAGWGDLTDLVGLGDYVAVGYHYLGLSAYAIEKAWRRGSPCGGGDTYGLGQSSRTR